MILKQDLKANKFSCHLEEKSRSAVSFFFQSKTWNHFLSLTQKQNRQLAKRKLQGTMAISVQPQTDPHNMPRVVTVVPGVNPQGSASPPNRRGINEPRHECGSSARRITRGARVPMPQGPRPQRWAGTGVQNPAPWRALAQGPGSVAGVTGVSSPPSRLSSSSPLSEQKRNLTAPIRDPAPKVRGPPGPPVQSGR